MRSLALLSVVMVLFSLFGCKDNGSVSRSEGVLQLFLTDKPAKLEKVNVTIGEIDIHQTGGPWKVFLQSTKTFDLLELKNTQALLAMGDLPDGMYTGLRLRVQSGQVLWTDGQTCELTVPSDKIQVPVVFEIQKGALTKVVLDFDAEESVHVIRTGDNQRDRKSTRL